MAKNLLIVESPAKAGTIKKYLGKDYNVVASKGHVIDLPKSRLAVDIDNDFEPQYITIRGKAQLLRELKKAASEATNVYLATDPDREGEAISWHLARALSINPDSACRITFNEITKNAVQEAVKQPRKIDMNLVDAQQARRVLDRLVGYQISPILWEKIKKNLSAGRVQSVALRLICEREEAIISFVPEEFWTIDLEMKKGAKKFQARYFGEGTKEVKLNNASDAEKILNDIQDKDATVSSVKLGSAKRNPAPPFTTSTLQQDASRKLGFSAMKTMQIAQGLYEGVNLGGKAGTVGLITYMRTDSLRLSPVAIKEANEYITTLYGENYATPRQFKSKGSAQDAHEAIRPTSVKFLPDAIKSKLTLDQYKLYKLIWSRFVAGQMSPAVYDTMNVQIKINGHVFKAAGSKLQFPGFTTIYTEGTDGKEEKEKMLPGLEKGDVVSVVKSDANQHFTQAPPRYTEASLVKELEEKGIGRPSTYAPTLYTIVDRGYVTRSRKILTPTELGMVTNDLLQKNFESLFNVDFTANMEDKLDEIGQGKLQWKSVIRDFYPDLEKSLQLARKNVEKVKLKDEESDVICEKCGRTMVYKIGKYGKFLACPGFPECSNVMPIRKGTGCACPKCGGEILIRKSRKGKKFYLCENSPKCDYISWDEPVKKEKCPKCGSLLVKRSFHGKKILCTNENCDYERKTK